MFFGNPPGSNQAIYDAVQRRWYSYRELAAEVDRVSEVLEVERKALIFCFCRNDFPSLVWYLAALGSGQAVALLDAGLAPEFRRQLIALYDPELVLASVDLGVDGEHGEIGSGWHMWRRPATEWPPIHPELTLLLSTSGSTGSPKFVRLTAQNVRANAASICESLAIVPEDRAITSLPLHYSYGMSVVNTHLLAGASLVLTGEGLASAGFWNVFRETACTSFAGVPYSYQMLARLNVENLRIESLQTMTQAGGKLNNDLISKFHDVMARRNGRLFVMYGQTEAAPRIATLPSGCLPAKLGSAGLALPGGKLEVDAGGALTTEPNRAGELVYSGPNVMMGYATCRADLEQGDVLGGRLYTGNGAYFDEDGFLFLTGRMKRDAKLYGLRLNLDEIESILRRHGPTAVISSGEKLLIFCEYGDEPTFTKYKQELAAQLKVNHQALDFRRIERLPLNANGKIDYQALQSGV